MYNKYKANLSREKFFNNWIKEQVSAMTEEMKDCAYEKYLLKVKVFNRDNFTCQNEGCKYCKNIKEFPKLTIHHIKHKRNGGEDKERNCVLICRPGHSNFNKKKDSLVFGLQSNLPPHIRGHTFKLHIEEEINWKELKVKMDALKRELKTQYRKSNGDSWFKVTMEQMIILMKFLDKRYVEYDGDD